VRDGDPEARFMREHSKEEIVDMLRKHTYDAEFDHHRKRIMMTEDWSASMNNAEASGLEVSGLRANVSQENQGTVYPNANVSSCAASAAEDTGDLPREHLFDKALTPSDVGKLNRLVIPKQHAEKYFPLDANSSEKGLLLNFEDSTGKVWQFRYSYWNSSQSYVLTKGWSRFVKDKTLEAGDIVSFHKGLAQTDQFYISWRRRPPGQPGRGFDPHYQKSKGGVVYPIKGPSFSNPFNSGAQAVVVNNVAQWMPIFWPSSSNPNAFTQFSSHSVSSPVNKICHVDALRSECSVAPLNGAIPFYFSAAPTKQTVQNRFNDNNSDGLQPIDLYLHLKKSLNSCDGSTDIKPLHPFVKPARPSTAQELEAPEHKAASSFDPATKKGVRLFGVTLAEPQRLSAQHHGQLNLFL
jgi:hypothetical protein